MQNDTLTHGSPALLNTNEQPIMKRLERTHHQLTLRRMDANTTKSTNYNYTPCTSPTNPNYPSTNYYKLSTNQTFTPQFERFKTMPRKNLEYALALCLLKLKENKYLEEVHSNLCKQFYNLNQDHQVLNIRYSNEQKKVEKLMKLNDHLTQENNFLKSNRKNIAERKKISL